MQIRNLVAAVAISTMSMGVFAQVPAGGMHEHPEGRADLHAVRHEGRIEVERHEGRIEIERRLERQDERIFHKVRAGLMTPAQAAVLRGEDNRVRGEMREMEAHHNGFLTGEDRVALNHQLDEISRRIGRG